MNEANSYCEQGSKHVGLHFGYSPTKYKGGAMVGKHEPKEKAITNNCRNRFQSCMWCRDQESNQGHTDFQSVALPTELRYLLSASKIDSILLFPKLFYKNAFVNLSI